MTKTERMIYVDSILEVLDYCKDRDAPTNLLPAECKVLLEYVMELRAANITLAQALSEVPD